MKMADGGFRPAYNVQFAADTGGGAVAGVAVDNVGSDMGKMAPMNEALAAAYGTRPAEHLADGGFAKRTSVDEYRLQGRGGLGIRVAKLPDDRGHLVGAAVVDPGLQYGSAEIAEPAAGKLRAMGPDPVTITPVEVSLWAHA